MTSSGRVLNEILIPVLFSLKKEIALAYCAIVRRRRRKTRAIRQLTMLPAAAAATTTAERPLSSFSPALSLPFSRNRIMRERGAFRILKDPYGDNEGTWPPSLHKHR